MARFEAVFYEGEDDERLPEWQVVEWTVDDGKGNRAGKTIWKTYDLVFGEQDAKDRAYHLQQVYDWETANGTA